MKGLLLNSEEVKQMRSDLSSDSIFANTIKKEITLADEFCECDICVPGYGVAESFEHNQHKKNSYMIERLAYLYLLVDNAKYIDTINKLLQAYTKMYNSIEYPPQGKTHNPVGKFYHQILNEHMWVLSVCIGISHVYDSLDQAILEDFKKNMLTAQLEYFVDPDNQFCIIHNHGIWSAVACAAAAKVLENEKVFEDSIKGLGNGVNAGFLAELDELFSPDGYYEEGPYYGRFALWPSFVFAEIIERSGYPVDIYEYREQILKKGYYTLLNCCTDDGEIFPINDAINGNNINRPVGANTGYKVAAALCNQRYGATPELLNHVQKQGVVWPYYAGYLVSKELANFKGISTTPVTKVFSNGPKGEKGATGVMKSYDKNYTLLFLAGSHGLKEHGHFDGLHVSLFKDSTAILSDFGSSRWANLESKYDGCYTVQNTAYGKQTIAHNTVVVNEKSFHGGQGIVAEKHDGKFNFYDKQDKLQVFSATIEEYHEDINSMTRFVGLYEGFENPLMLDVMLIDSDKENTYDQPYHYKGYPSYRSMDLKFDVPKVLSKDFGYQHIYQLSKATNLPKSCIWTWVNECAPFHSLIMDSKDSESFVVAETGANDPDFNLKRDSMVILRKKGKDVVFATALETHGYFDAPIETTTGVYSQVKEVEVVYHDKQTVVVAFRVDPIVDCVADDCEILPRKTYFFGVSKENKEHSISVNGQTYAWSGYSVVKEL